jgi:hypothetical protein
MKTRIGGLCILSIAAACLTLGETSYLFAAEDSTHEGVVVTAGSGKLAMTGVDGKEHSYDIGDAVQIKVNGRMGKLDDLKMGIRIRVTTDKSGHALTVATVDATKGRVAVFETRRTGHQA